MSREQPRRPQEIRYGDAFNVVGDLASQPIAPQVADAMQSAENKLLGKTQRGGPEAVMQSAACLNTREGLVSRDKSNIAAGDGAPLVGVSKLKNDGNALVAEEICGQVGAQHVKPEVPSRTQVAIDRDAVIIGEALEAVAFSDGKKPVNQSDAAAIQAAEMRAFQSDAIRPGGVAATQNERTMRDEDKTKLADVLSDATRTLPVDKPVTNQVAEAVIAAELRNKPDMNSTPGGLGATMAAAAKMNSQNKSI